MQRALTLPLGDQVPTRGNRLSRALGRLAFRLSGWRLEGAIPNLPRFLIIAAPHTSNWDFLIGVCTLFAIGFRVSWLGKHTIFRWPARGILRWLGGIPVNRGRDQGHVDRAISAFREREKLILTIAPEGTRKKVPTWRTGFYRIALGAGVPIVPAWFDYRRKVVGFRDPIVPTGDLEADMVRIRAGYDGVTPRHPHLF